jgi:DNA polymerase I-like protein with 3'-5' exonuclease and polymerase domains
MQTDLVLYTPTKLKPPVEDVVRALAEDYGSIGKVILWEENTDPELPVLCLGGVPTPEPKRFVKALSQNQVMAGASATTELAAAIDLFVKPPKMRPFSYVIWEPDACGKLETDLGNYVVVDIETGGDIKLMLREENWLLSVALYDGKKCIVLSEQWLRIAANQQQLTDFLMNKKRKLIAHNMKFDFRSLSAQLNAPIYGHMDTMLLHHAINPGAKEHGLKALARKYLGVDDWDTAAKVYVKGKYKDISALPETYFYPTDVWDKYFDRHGDIAVGYEAIPRDMLYKYNALDVYNTWHLMEYLLKFADTRVTRVALHEYQMNNLFQDVESWGITVDMEHIENLRAELEEEKGGYMTQLAELVHPDFNPNSPKQVKEIYTAAEIELKSTDEPTLTELMRQTGLHPKVKEFTERLLDVRGVNKLLGTYVKGITKRTHGVTVFPTYNVHGTNTGRLSSSDPNIQNIPRDKRLRRLFTVEDVDNQDFLEVDYSQAELRVMAVLSQDKYLMSLLQPDMPDFFDSLLPVAFPNASISSWNAQERKDNRANLKGVIYGLSYGRKAFAIGTALNIPVWQAQKIIDNYFSAAPDFYTWRMKT